MMWGSQKVSEHRWFAWYPVTLTHGEHKGCKVWLEPVATRWYREEKAWGYRTLAEWTVEVLNPLEIKNTLLDIQEARRRWTIDLQGSDSIN